MKTVRQFLEEKNKKDGYETDEHSLIETMVDSGKIVHREGRDVHRWYICEDEVLRKTYSQVIAAGDVDDDTCLQMPMEKRVTRCPRCGYKELR